MSEENNDLALESRGCIVSHTSCKHSELAPSRHIIDGSRTTFWATTGLYPHTFILTFPSHVFIVGIKMRSYLVKSVRIEKCNNDVSLDFDEIKSCELERTDLHHQITEIEVESKPARHLRFTIKEGYEEFCAVYKVEVLGSKMGSGPDTVEEREVTVVLGKGEVGPPDQHETFLDRQKSASKHLQVVNERYNGAMKRVSHRGFGSALSTSLFSGTSVTQSSTTSYSTGTP